MTTNTQAISAIQTRYKGYRFRSRTEARWAVFLDALNVDWKYEDEGFALPDGDRYLPDFYLPQFGMFLEIKGVVPSWDDFQKCRSLSIYSKKPVILAIGIPPGEFLSVFFWRQQWYFCGSRGECNWCGFSPLCFTEARGFFIDDPDKGFDIAVEQRVSGLQPGDAIAPWGAVNGDPGDPNFCTFTEVLVDGNGEYVNTKGEPLPFCIELISAATQDAKSARFEYGESGAPQ